jgi:hypothetical protein
MDYKRINNHIICKFVSPQIFKLMPFISVKWRHDKILK